jgi:hypothetical protein
MKDCKFVDGLFYLGDPYMSKGLSPEGALEILDGAGIDSAVILTREQEFYAPDAAAEHIKSLLEKYKRFYGLYPMVPDCTGDLPPIESAVISPEFSRFAGFALLPDTHRIPRHPVYLREYFEAAIRYHIPVWYNISSDNDYVYIASVLEAFPELCAVLSFDDEWPNNRRVYPLLKFFKNTCLLTSNMIWMGAYEDFVGTIGAERLIFATRAPVKYPGAAMFDLRKAEISEDDKAKIAWENITRLIGGKV